ncbi:tRNA (guanosine(37)-N1)-methyltransferase TrmD [Candidatus Kaiserbacteria bacterium CG10_big_fil_rev_8_21_14_0_10_56_12]|uniref:tRNA (guanine-N(1)-)-methyltransferase n=1 Tax=Candidatus Kaiserbacteria bacterium CG10_big_fil_rev_8_21_14_0_10_56_12 TaxID=1974611 RepID=A0A2H0UCV8_9BACT|nr:MAG: tRNA (guanosine(37)-N1)-methyltransferase TrmD [Candidatus Kaiserbacteria bacterium CG10_big_fil_rev_8_21_14_0_10_56_12]
MRFHLITLFPDACDAYLSASIIGRARTGKKIGITYQNPRDFATQTPHQKATNLRRVDDRPYGGGPGMVMQALPVVKAVEKALRAKKKPMVVWFSPSGKQFTNKDADALVAYSDVVLVCGRYEGIDERAKKIIKALAPVKEFAVGEAVYTGGELPALAIVDAVTRRLPGVLGKDTSVEERRVASHAVYTRPEAISYKKKTYKAPKVLQTGHHAKIDAWRGKK